VERAWRCPNETRRWGKPFFYVGRKLAVFLLALLRRGAFDGFLGISVWVAGLAFPQITSPRFFIADFRRGGLCGTKTNPPLKVAPELRIWFAHLWSALRPSVNETGG